MPQPLRKPCHLTFSGLRSRPRHAQVIGQIVAISGRIESRLASLLAIMTGGLTHVTVPMFLAVRSTDAQRAMLSAAAEQVLQADSLQRFTELMAEWKQRYGERNKLVHNIWGHSDDHPDLAIRIASEDFSEVWKATSAGGDILALQQNIGIINELWRSCEGWRVKDLESVEKRLDDYEVRIAKFWQELFTQQFSIIVPTTTGLVGLLDEPKTP